MNPRSRLVAVALAATVPFGLAACGSGNAQADHAKSSIKTMLLSDQKTDTTSPHLTDPQAGCIADNVVNKIGVKQLVTDGLLDKKNNAVTKGLDKAKLSSADATSLVNSMFDCTSGGASIIASLKKSIDGEAAGASAAALSCIDSKLTTAFTKQLMVKIFTRDETGATQLMQTTMSGCLTGAN